jgi:hypothetical protein
MLIAFSKRAAYMTDGNAYDWFWIFLHNLGLTEFTDDHANLNAINEILETFIWRMYEDDGNGGMFPMNTYREDERTVELWFQLCEYLVDHDLLD